MINEFSNTYINKEHDDDESEKCQKEDNIDMKLSNKVENHKIVQLKNNFIPKILIPLERLLKKMMSLTILKFNQRKNTLKK